MLPPNQPDDLFESLPDASMVCNREGKIQRLNAAALELFEVASDDQYRGIFCREFLARYTLVEPPSSILPEPWLLSLITGKSAASGGQSEALLLQLPSGRRVSLDLSSSPVFDAQQQMVGTVHLFHDITSQSQKALHLQQVLQAVLILTEAIAHIPDYLGLSFPEDMLLLSSPALFVSQQLVDAISQILDYQRVSLIAVAPHTGRLYYVAGSGFTAEQEQHRHEIAGRFSPLAFIDEEIYADLASNKEVILPADRLRLPAGFQSPFGAEQLLLVPLFLTGQLAGGLCIVKAGWESTYTPEEIAFVKVVTAQTALIMECLQCWSEQTESQSKDMVQREMHRLTTDFLTLASHELRTPLTTIKGNIQLTQRRLALLKRQVVGPQSRRVDEHVAQMQNPLRSALQSVRLQERMLNDLIDDACLQAGRLELDLQECDLLLLLKEVVAEQQQSAPDHTIFLESTVEEAAVPIKGDASRLKRVLATYLANAVDYSPADRPVIVQVAIIEGCMRITVHDSGPGIPAAEQGHLWQRFYRAKGLAVQHELDLSLGLGLYLCKAFVERHHGSVGMQSNPGHGSTFWLRIPLASPGKMEKQEAERHSG